MDGARHQIHIELELDGSAPYGTATLAGGETRTFAGWVGLVSAVDDLVREDDDPKPEEPPG